MAVIDRTGKGLPEGHPFKGTRIVFGMNRPDSSATPSTEATPGDPVVSIMALVDQGKMDEARALLEQKRPELTRDDPMRHAAVGAEIALRELMAETYRNMPAK